jgi:hypothetical protein
MIYKKETLDKMSSRIEETAKAASQKPFLSPEYGAKLEEFNIRF